MAVQSRIANLWELAQQIGRHPLSRQVGWLVIPFGGQQILRLGNQIVLASLLAPAIFGLMALIHTLRTGAELLSDVGIGQSVVRSPHAEDREFLNTAWTLQVLRGALLSVAVAAAAVPIGHLYDLPEVTPVLLFVSPVFLISGLLSPSLFLMQRNMMLRSRAIYDVVCLVFQCVFTIALAWYMPTVWALAWGLVVSTVFSTAASYAFGYRIRPRFAWHREHVREIFSFGKWIFLSTAVYFAATNVDRIYFVAALTLAMVGVYNIARNFADMIGQLGQKIGGFIIFPKFVALSERGAEAAPGLRKKRFQFLVLMALGMAGTIAVFDKAILISLDERYHAGAFMIPILLAGVWFNVLSSFAEAMLFGGGRSAPVARANTIKFLVLLVGLPLAVGHGSLLEALLVMILAEAARWAALAIEVHKLGFAKVRDDVALTMLMVLAALAFKVVLGWIGVVPTLAEWWALGEAVRG